MASPPLLTPLPPSLQRTLEEDLARGQWSHATVQWFVELLKKLDDLERRLTALEP